MLVYLPYVKYHMDQMEVPETKAYIAHHENYSQTENTHQWYYN